jgi:hypothetical protein
MRQLKLRARPDQVERYSPDYLDNITQAYLANQQSLKSIAEQTYESPRGGYDYDNFEERRLLEQQDQLLQLAALVQPSELGELKEILTLWHQVAIKEVADEDITAADKLILNVHRFCQENAESY